MPDSGRFFAATDISGQHTTILNKGQSQIFFLIYTIHQLHGHKSPAPGIVAVNFYSSVNLIYYEKIQCIPCYLAMLSYDVHRPAHNGCLQTGAGEQPPDF
jgi:hypothetical protein